jgi:hypothetical protein
MQVVQVSKNDKVVSLPDQTRYCSLKQHLWWHLLCLQQYFAAACSTGSLVVVSIILTKVDVDDYGVEVMKPNH